MGMHPAHAVHSASPQQLPMCGRRMGHTAAPEVHSVPVPTQLSQLQQPLWGVESTPCTVERSVSIKEEGTVGIGMFG